MTARSLTVASACSVLLLATPAEASGPFDDLTTLPEGQRPGTLPELTHPSGDATIDFTAGVVNDRELSPTRGHVPVDVLHASVERSVLGRQFFGGARYLAAFGGPATRERMRPLGGNLELYGRAVWATVTGLTFGGGIGLMIPTAHYDRESPIRDLAVAAAALRPWDIAFFEDDTLALRPFLDARYLVGRFAFQARQAFDGLFHVGSGGPPPRIFAVTTLYVGLRIGDQVVAGFEAHELYLVDAPVPDERRAFFDVTPMIRLDLDPIEPQIALTTSVGPPLVPGADRVWAARTGMTFHF